MKKRDSFLLRIIVTSDLCFLLVENTHGQTVILPGVEGGPFSYQGELYDSQLDPIEGSVDLTFRIFDDIEGGTMLHESVIAQVPVAGGSFNVVLEDVTAEEFHVPGEHRYLEIQVGQGVPIAPRQEIFAVLAARWSEFAHRIQNGAIELGEQGGEGGGNISVKGPNGQSVLFLQSNADTDSEGGRIDLMNDAGRRLVVLEMNNFPGGSPNHGKVSVAGSAVLAARLNPASETNTRSQGFLEVQESGAYTRIHSDRGLLSVPLNRVRFQFLGNSDEMIDNTSVQFSRGHHESVTELGRDNEPLFRWNEGVFKVFAGDGVPNAGTIEAAIFREVSDERLKESVSDIVTPLAFVRQLRGVQFQWKDGNRGEGATASGNQYGVIAQELEAVLPELVSTGEDGMKSVRYTGLIPVLIEAVKEQQETIEKQAQSIDRLERMVEELISSRQ